MIKVISARRSFELEDQDSGMNVKIKKGDRGELLGAKRAGKGYTVIINDKTITIGERKILRYLFKEER
jgi:hypothetical protein